jgi:uncharacterized protein (DUF488 family)
MVTANPPGRPTVLFTIGYEKAAQRDLLAVLRDAGVVHVVDVRDRPLSRRAGFSKRQLQAGVEEAGMRYIHLTALGTPPEGREANHQREWDRFWQIVDDKLATGEAEADLQRAGALAQEAPTCLLCYEADWRKCHRLRVAEILARRQPIEMRHLAVPGVEA